MKNLNMENPDNMWVRLDNGVYTTPIFVEGVPNPLFNSLPNSPYLTNGNKVEYMGFLEGKNGTTKFDTEMLFVVLYGSCIAKKDIKLRTRNAIFAKEIFCENGSIVLVFIPKAINEYVKPLVETSETSNKIPYATKYRVYGKKLGENIFFKSWNGLDYTFHCFTQHSLTNVARGAHAAGFYRKNLMVHMGKIHMKTYLPYENVIVETIVSKTEDYYEGYYISGFCYHSFRAIEETIDTIFVERNYGIPMQTFPVKALFGNDIVCGKRDGQAPSTVQIKTINSADVIKL